MKRIFFTATLSLILITNIGYGQRGYYIKGDVKKFGVKIIDQGDKLNSEVCLVKKDEESSQKFTPSDIEGYGINKKKDYISRKIEFAHKNSRVFLQQLTKGKIKLYYFRDQSIKLFMYELADGSFHYLPKEEANFNYKDKLAELTNECDQSAKKIRLLKYKKDYLKKFIDNYNNCSNEPFNFLKYGVVLGAGVSKLDLGITDELEIKNIKKGNESAFQVGFFLNNPFNMSSFSFHSELLLNFYKHRFGSGFTESTLGLGYFYEEWTYETKKVSMSIPLLIRYSAPTRIIRPYINVGISLNKSFNIQERFKVTLINIYSENQNQEIERDPSLQPYSQVGFLGGLGLEVPLSVRNSIFIEYRYEHLLSVPDIGKFEQIDQFLRISFNI